MPIYEYRCLACGDQFERLVYGDAVVECPDCGSANVGRRLSLFGVKSGSTFVASRGGGCGCASGGG